jgi:glucose-1-phosphate cytidylyltransferase
MSDVTFHIRENRLETHQQYGEDWKVTLINTGDATMTGGRLARIRDYVADEEAFCMTYGDGVANVDIDALVAFHRKHGKLATLTATHPPGRFGALQIEGEQVTAFAEKPKGDGAMINGGFFVLSPKVLDLIEGDHTIWEREPMERLAAAQQLCAFRHDGFWQPMDTLRDKNYLEELWQSGEAPWKVWR